MLITKREEVMSKILWRKLRPRGSLLLEFIQSSGWGGGGRLFEAGRLLTFSAFRMGAYSRWALIRGWALIRINSVDHYFYSSMEWRRLVCVIDFASRQK